MFWTHAGICRVLILLVGAFFMLTVGVAATPAMAQFSIPCNTSAVYTPDIAAYNFSSVDIEGAIKSSNPAVASATRGRAGGGTAGAITIKSNGQSGETTITYTIEDFSGKTKEIAVAVTVDCTGLQHLPKEPPQQPPQAFGPLDFVYTDCKECVREANTLNSDIVSYNLALTSGAPSAELGNRAVKIRRDRAAFKDCEEKKCGPHPPLTQRPLVKHYPEPHTVVTRCKNPECIAIQDKLNADIEAFNQAVAAGKTPTDQLDAMLANINREGQELNACEKKCVPKQAAAPTPAPAPPKPAAPPPAQTTTPALPALEPSPPQQNLRPADQVAGVFSAPATVNVDYANVYSATTFTTPTDTLKIHSQTNQVQLSGQANAGPWYLFSQVGFAGAPGGGFSDMFPAFSAANFSGQVNSGSVYSFTADGGYNFIQWPDLRARAFAGYYSFSEYLSGTIAGGTATMPLLSDHWQAARLGFGVEKAFLVDGRAVVIKMDIVCMPLVNLQSGAFNGHGDGASGNLVVSFPIPELPLQGNVFLQDTYMKASGNTFGVPMDVKNNNVTVGAGFTFGLQGLNLGEKLRY
jgi:hypothetical protein